MRQDTVRKNRYLEMNHICYPTSTGDLASAAVTLREGVREILQYYDAISPVVLVKMIPEPVSSPRELWEARKGSGGLLHTCWEYDDMYLW